jgi:hypothetical protein
MTWLMILATVSIGAIWVLGRRVARSARFLSGWVWPMCWLATASAVAVLFGGSPRWLRASYQTLQRLVALQVLRRAVQTCTGQMTLPAAFSVGVAPEDMATIEINLAQFLAGTLKAVTDTALRANLAMAGGPTIRIAVSPLATPGRPIIRVISGAEEVRGLLAELKPTRGASRAATASISQNVPKTWEMSELLLEPVGHDEPRLRLGPGEVSLTVGRGDEADLLLSDPAVSRVHFRLQRHRDGLEVKDLGSKNGTTVNGKPVIRATAIQPGDDVGVAGRIHYRCVAP